MTPGAFNKRAILHLSLIRASLIFGGVLLFFSSEHLSAQDVYTGTFMTVDQTVTLQLKPVGEGYHGIVQSNEGIFVLEGHLQGEKMKGTVFTDLDRHNFLASPLYGGLEVLFEGNTYQFFQVSSAHQLADVDLSSYLSEGGVKTDTDKGAVTDSNPGQHEILGYIAGSQLVFYQRTSYLNDSRASSLTYMNFCPDGRFTLTYDGSFSVEGDFGGNAHGVSSGSNHGTWQLKEFQGSPVVHLHFANGEKSVHPVNKAHLKSGRWRIGNTQYALVRDKVVCR